MNAFLYWSGKFSTNQISINPFDGKDSIGIEGEKKVSILSDMFSKQIICHNNAIK